MPLFVIATPIGNPKDITLHAVEALKAADLVIGEELKVLRQILKNAGVQAPKMEQLNEHSTADDIDFFVGECREKNVALVSDCGTPGFCDPGALLVKACRDQNIRVIAAPGPSSLMALLSVSGERVDEFLFRGFLPAKNEERASALRTLASEKRAVILMDTPYRLQKLMADIAATFPRRNCVVGINLTQEIELVVRGKGSELPQLVNLEDGEPIVLILPG